MPIDAAKYDSNYYSPYGYWRVTDIDGGELIGYYQGNFDFIAFQLNLKMNDRTLQFEKIDFKNFDKATNVTLPESAVIKLVYDIGFFVDAEAANKMLEGRPQVHAEKASGMNIRLIRQLSKKEKAEKVIENLTGNFTETDKNALKEAYEELIKLEYDTKFRPS